MDSREILPNAQTVRFLLDTKSLNERLSRNPFPLERFLTYGEHSEFTYIRTPEKTAHNSLQNISSFELEIDMDRNQKIVRWGKSNQNISTIRYLPSIYDRKLEDIDWSEPEPNIDELNLVGLFSEFSRYDDNRADILVTANPSLLQNRRRIEYSFHRHEAGQMNMMSPSEAAEFAGIFMRENDEFIFYNPKDKCHSYSIDFSYWYWLLPRVFIHHFTIDDNDYISSMFDRFQSLFICVDKMGKEYYCGTGNHTDLRTRYHFNNGISLLTGIFDVVALYTREKYDIGILDERTNLRTGGHPLLKELRVYNESAWEHVQRNHMIIELIHTIRNDIIHQKGVIKRGPGFSLRGSEVSEWNSHTISLESLDKEDREEFRKYYEQFDDSIRKYDPVTQWGVIVPENETPKITPITQIEPYQFMKQSVKTVAKFIDEYLRLLDHPNRLKNLPDTGILSKNDIHYMADCGLFPLFEQPDVKSVKNTI
ncbi:hypothetical protein [Natronorubrum tibetense]|uniref:hypothetical protein n=1 Tax=Natronorubrum tibetense TaxID=63128 RepID=UPI000B2BA09D|nr:hypothetical protein [Natronorubrum tibetense]